MSANFTPEKEDYKILTPFKMQVLTNFPYIEADFDALTNYQLLCKVVEYLNGVIHNENEVTEQINSLYNAYVSLQNYVNNYFDNLDVQEEVNNKLDDMVEQGTLQEIIADYLNSKAIFGFDTVADMQSATNLIDGSFARTLGYYSKNDEGGSLYKIREITNEDVVDNMSIISLTGNLIAELIFTNSMNIKQFGLLADGETDESTKLSNILNLVFNKKIKLNITNITLINSLIIRNNIAIDFNTITYNNTGSAIVIKSEDGCNINGKYLISQGKGLELNNDEITTTYGNVKDFYINIDNIISSSDAIWLNANLASKGIINGTIKAIVVKSTSGKGIIINGTNGWTGQIEFDITNIQSITDYAIYLTDENGTKLKGFNFPYTSFEGSKYGLYWKFTQNCEPIFGYFRTAEIESTDVHFKFSGGMNRLNEVSRIKFDRCSISGIDVSEITPSGHYQWGYIVLEGAIRCSSNIVSEAVIYSNFVTFTKYPHNAIYLTGNSNYEWDYGTKIADLVIPQNTNTFDVYIPKWLGVFGGRFGILIQNASWKNITIKSPDGSTIIDLSTLTFSANDIIYFEITDADQNEKVIWYVVKNATYPKNFKRFVS